MLARDLCSRNKSRLAYDQNRDLDTQAPTFPTDWLSVKVEIKADDSKSLTNLSIFCDDKDEQEFRPNSEFR